MVPRRPQRPSALVGVAGLAAAASAVLLLPGTLSGQSAQPNATSHVVRGSVSLPVAKKALGQFKEVRLRKGSSVGFRQDSRGPFLQFADSRRSGYVTVSTAISPQTAVGGTAQVNLARQHLRRGKTRALLMVESARGRSVQAGVIRVRDGSLHWAVWQKTAADARVGVVVSKRRAALRNWHTVQLVTRWGAKGRAVLKVDGDRVAATKLELDGAMAQRVTIGLGRPSSQKETGLLLVRSASFRTAVGNAVAGGGGGGGAGGTRPANPAPPAAGPVSTLPGRELMRADWETGNTNQWDSVQTVNRDRIQAVRSPVREGSFAGRFEVRPGEDPFCGSGGGGCYGARAEVSLDTNEAEGQERWYQWSTLVDQSVPSTNAFQVISQWHSRENGRPPVAMFVEGDNLLLMVHPHRAPGDQISFVRAWSGPVKRGTWRDIQMHVKWSGSDSVGFIELWVDGARQTFYNGTQTLRIRTMYPGVGNYFKQGYYRDNSVGGTGVVYHDNFRMSAPG
jgi:hypothetical protein